MPRMLPRGGTRPQQRIVVAVVVLLALLFFSRSICSFVIDYLWWRELGQAPTWLLMLVYRYAPGLAAWLIVFCVLWVAHARGMKQAGTGLGEHRLYSRLVTLGLVVVALVVALAAVDGWTVARYIGGREAAAGPASAAIWRDPVFGLPLGFYFFELPFYNMLVQFLAVCSLGAALAYYLAARGWQLRRDFPGFGAGNQIDFNDLKALGRLETGLLKGMITLFLIVLAAVFWLGRYDLLLSDHGNLMVGIDYVQQTVGLPLQTIKALASLLAAGLVLTGRRKLAVALCSGSRRGLVHSADFELALRTAQRVDARKTVSGAAHRSDPRAAFGFDHRTREVEFTAHKDGPIDFARNRALLDNVRLWDWRAFHDTLSQTQPLRPYTYADTDVDRYQINGQSRQTLLAPRELDLNQLGDARNRWINRSLIFTHGYGLVLAEANQITPEGLPELLVRDAPIQVLTPSLRVTRPEIYYGETASEPVFVRTAQPEFNYPSGSSEVNTRYDGSGGFPMSAPGLRTVAAVAQSDWNILLTNQLTPESRMMIRQRVPDRLSELAEFVTWDTDPYLVITDEGRLVWIVDGYMTSDAHPYARDVALENGERFNYIRNSIKATVDAYDGDVHLYVFDEEDPLVNAYRRLFPVLFQPESAMPADLRAHARSPELLFRAQAEIYRTYHMRDPESFYNRADMWDLATFTTGQGGQPEPVPPTYMIATLPGEAGPEFLLTVPFTPRNKQNLIGLMVARCDGPHLGEIVFLDLPKQEIIPGPIQVEALINQDQTISKDLTLWNQQGSQVLRSQILTLPIDQTFLYVAPIYIQASQARMPQLEKVALVVGNGDTLVYANTYEQALAELEALQKGQAPSKTAAPGAAPIVSSLSASATPATGDTRLDEIRAHLRRYRDLSAQGKWAEAGKELEAIDAAVRK